MTKAYLRRCKAEAKEVETIKAQIETLRELRGFTASCFDSNGGHSTETQSKVERTVERIVMLEAKYADKLESYMTIRHTIEDAIADLPTKQQNLIRWYYCTGLTWEEVAEKLDVSYTHVHRLHAAALIALRES